MNHLSDFYLLSVLCVVSPSFSTQSVEAAGFALIMFLA